MGFYVQTGATGDGSALIDSGAIHEVTEIDIRVTSYGFYTVERSTVAPKRLYRVGWIGLSILGSWPPGFTDSIQFMNMVHFVEAQNLIITEPTGAPAATNWDADTLMWGVADAVIDIAVYW